MKKPLIYIFLFLFFTVAGNAFSEEMSVVIKEAQIRSAPSFLGKIIEVVPYGRRLEILEKTKDWVEVILSGGTGWVHESALTRKKVVLSAGEGVGETGASSDEIALAGKGFNAQVEAQYKEELELDYTWVDEMEGIVVPTEEIVAFLESGYLEYDLGAE